MIEFVNRQRRRSMDPKRWRLLAEAALDRLGVKRQRATVVFVSDRAIRLLNQRFRGRKTATDVLSFPSGQTKFERRANPNLGDVVISVERAAAQAALHGLEFDQEVAQLILHGLLHLCGYDHETDDGQMNRLELRLRRHLGI